MTYPAASTLDFLDEHEEEKIIREYEQECANEDVLDIRNIRQIERSNGDHLPPNKIDKCLNISDDEYLKNLNELDDSRDGSLDNKFISKPVYYNTSIPLFTLDNLNKVARRKLKESNRLDRLETDPFDFNLLDNQLDNLTNFTNAFNESNGHQSNGHASSSDLSNSHLNNSSTNNLSANLSNLTNNLSLSTSTNSSNDNLLDSSVNLKRKKSNSIITFEIISAKSVLSSITNSSRRFVVYTIIIKRTPGLETKPGIIEKRYSDFLRFFLLLRKSFPLLFDQFPFPRKIYSNNFETEIIFERSQTFQHLLTYCLSVRQLRTSSIFYEFILHQEIKKCRRLLRGSQFEEAVINLENLNYILIKLNQIETSMYLRSNIFVTYLALASCLNEIEEFNEAATYADDAFKMTLFNNDFDKNELLVPFLLLSVQLNSRLSKPCQMQNQKLLELSDNGIIHDKNLSDNLIDLFILKNYFILTP